MTILDKDYQSPYEREEVIIVSDWVDEHPAKVFKKLKANPELYKTKKQTILSLLQSDDIAKEAKERLGFAKMRMDPTDITDILSDNHYVNGKSKYHIKKSNGKVLLRVINAAAANYYEISSGLGKMLNIVAADGNDVQRVSIKVLPIAIAETYDIEVDSSEEDTIVFETLDRRGVAFLDIGGDKEFVFRHKEPKVLKMMDVMDMGGMDSGDHMMDMGGMDNGDHMMDMGGMRVENEFSYDLLLMKRPMAMMKYDYTTVMRLTGDMNRYIWSINDIRYVDSDSIKWKKGDVVRIDFKNETMMNHPMHLHGMWMRIINKNGDYSPKKHTINIPPKKNVSVIVEVDNVGNWAFHCHILYHMAAGMFRRVEVLK